MTLEVTRSFNNLYDVTSFFNLEEVAGATVPVSEAGIYFSDSVNNFMMIRDLVTPSQKSMDGRPLASFFFFP